MKTKKSHNPIEIYYLANRLYKSNHEVLAKILQLFLFLVFKAVVPYKASIDEGCILAHGGNGVVIHPEVVIGKNVLICHQVTIGGARKKLVFPRIGDDVYIGAGAKILGAIVIEGSSVIGANAVVTKSIPRGSIVVGVPGRIIHEGVDPHDFEEW
jgi:serine O-acetyltransferase